MKGFKPLISAVMVTAASAVLANPQGFQPMAGEAALSLSDAHTLEVTTGKQAIIQWDSFSIDSHETTRFVMPDSHASVLNRVLGGDMSQILGTLEANGKVFLINPKGVLVGQDAEVNTASFIASSFDIMNSAFMEGGDIAFQGTSGSVVNLGKITAWDGDVLLVGFQVRNEGSIQAPQGVAGLAAGTEVFLRPAHDERILIRAQLSEAIADVGVTNTGTISALQAELKADGNLYSYAIKDSGQIDALAKCRRGHNRIYLVADQGNVETSGALTATGGVIHILGDEVTVLNGAYINVSSEEGGGVALIGGDYKGLNPEIANAKRVYIQEEVVIEANATLDGNGGKVIMWGDHYTGFYGKVSAEGGQFGGDGGFIEISSKNVIVAEGSISTSALYGATGTLLLDPCFVTITSSVDIGFVPSSPPNYVFTGTTSNINTSSLANHLASNNVTINASASGTNTVGTIIFQEDPLSWTSSNTLSLIANDSSASSIALLESLSAPNGSLNVLAPIIYVGDNNQELPIPMTVQAANITLNANTSFSNFVGIFGSNVTNASTRLTGTTISLNIDGDLVIQSGNAQNAYSAIIAEGTTSTLGNVFANVTGGVFLNAGDAPLSSAAIIGNNANITIGTVMTGADSITITASNVAPSSALIATNSEGYIQINTVGDVTLNAGSIPGSNADIVTYGSGDTDGHITITTDSGNVILNAGF